MIKLILTTITVSCLLTNIMGCSSTSSNLDNSTTTSNNLEQKNVERSAYLPLPLPENKSLVGTDPEQIALELFGTSEIPTEGNFKQEVILQEKSEDKAIVILTQTGLLDDSVKGMRYYLEFIPEGEQWQLNWSGRQVICYANRGSQVWSKENCS